MLQAVEIGKGEFVLGEMDFNLSEALRSLSQVTYLLAEYRVRILDYKYAKYSELDKARKLSNLKEKRSGEPGGDDLEELAKEVAETKDEWEEQKMNKEKLEVLNAKKQATYWLETLVRVNEC